mgnify:CR=1 FL=1
MTEIELTLTDFSKSEEELQEIADDITINFEKGTVQLLGDGFNKVYMF